jgi:hypothetical protein
MVGLSLSVSDITQMNAQEKTILRTSLEEWVGSIAAKLSLDEAEIANEAFYSLQRHKVWGHNATSAQKRAAYKHWNTHCQNGHELSFEDATFHHLTRGIPNQHEPANLVPLCRTCHDAKHGVRRGSILKGSPRTRA